MIVLYSTETCPRCKILKEKMDEKKIEYKECHDMDVMKALKILSVPVLVNQMDFSEANNWVNNYEEDK